MRQTAVRLYRARRCWRVN